MTKKLLLCAAIAFAVAPVIWLAPEPDESIVAFGKGEKPVVVIDPGHGGEDSGAIGVSGIKESGINLAVSVKTEKLLRFFGQRTVMTRSADISIYDEGISTIAGKKRSDLKNRVKIVRSIPNAVLISVHQNFFEQAQYKGAQVFYGDKAFAEFTQENLRLLDTSNKRGAKAIPNSIYLMKNVDCPAILVECGFISNPSDAAKLTDAAYQKKLAAAICASYLKYSETFGSG